MKFALMVNQGPYTYQASDTAYHFVRAALNAGHEVVRIFFYHDGVYAANLLISPPQDEPDIGSMWQNFAGEHDLDLVACIASCLRRGVVDETEAARHDKPAANLRPGFTISGLGQLIDATINADRVVTFGY